MLFFCFKPHNNSDGDNQILQSGFGIWSLAQGHFESARRPLMDICWLLNLRDLSFFAANICRRGGNDLIDLLKTSADWAKEGNRSVSEPVQVTRWTLQSKCDLLGITCIYSSWQRSTWLQKSPHQLLPLRVEGVYIGYSHILGLCSGLISSPSSRTIDISATYIQLLLHFWWIASILLHSKIHCPRYSSY